LVPVRKEPGLKAGAFSPALLVPVAAPGINGLYKPGLKAFFPPVIYSLGSIILFANVDISRYILIIVTSVLAKSNMDQREYIK
jgi:hypothetical protein